jgi:hypothetical protein
MGMRSGKGFSGKWAGQYTYGYGYSERLKGKSAPFTIIMQVDGKGIITGECIDDGYSDQIDGRAIIEGEIVHQHIKFVKKYRYHWTTSSDGTTAQENKAREGNEVHYSGEYRNNVFTGEWKIISVRVLADGSLKQWESQGYWIMHRTD